MNAIKPLTYHYAIDGHDIAITRRHIGTAYARNGNVGNPTQYFTWEVSVDGEYLAGHIAQRALAYEEARCHIARTPYVNLDSVHRYVNVRNVYLVQREMKANYKGRS